MLRTVGDQRGVNGGSLDPRQYRPSLVCRFLMACALLSAMAITAAAQPQPTTASSAVGTVRIDATQGHAINTFDPDSALGTSIDVLSRRDIDKVFTPTF